MNKKYKLLIIFIGQFVGFIILLIAFSIFNGVENKHFEKYFGNTYYTRYIQFSATDVEKFNKNFMQEILKNINEDTQVSIDASVPLKNNDKLPYEPVFIKYSKDPSYKFRIRKGRDLTYNETVSESKVALVGYDIYNELDNKNIETQDVYINIAGKNFKVVGVIGSDKFDSPLNDVVIMPIHSYSEDMMKDDYKTKDPAQRLSNIYLNIYVSDKNSPDLEGQKVEKNLKGYFNQNLQLNYQNIEKEDSYDIGISYKTMIIFAFLIFIISIINNSNLIIDWINSESYNISIKMALGSTKWMIFGEFLRMMCFISMSSVLVATLLFKFSIPLLQDFNSVELILNSVDIFKLVGVSLIVSIISTSSAILKLSNLNIANNIKSLE